MESFVLPVGPAVKVANLLFFVPDLVILYTCLKYGPADFSHPLIRKWFYPLVGLGVVMAASVEAGFLVAYRDWMGNVTGNFANVLLSALFVSMILRRRSVHGQSLYIALCILVANIFAWPACVLSAAPNPRPPPLLGHACFLCIISLNLIYTALVYRQCRMDGVNPWRRL
jgi:hypothetical protein